MKGVTMKLKAKALVVCGMALLPACVGPTSDMRGDVVAVNDRTVTVRGLAGVSMLNPEMPTPTPAMIAQAKEICPNAEFLSSQFVDEDVPLEIQADYLFLCK